MYGDIQYGIGNLADEIYIAFQEPIRSEFAQEYEVFDEGFKDALYFSGLKFEGDTDITGDEDNNVDETTVVDGITLPASFYAQTAYSGRIGNWIYSGRTINFAGQLTDTGV
ncbi:uncharacterized protein PV07_12091 [Cladophialophora immunda]|uniref:Uncharacterized protein n=1 Tax=Cladophialophora immunda TaxID=569365 RepID=A0A0D2BUT8_9EURO|nr:uncharacterized protein PV07_12091 [Cladophialophora immunda]KIW22180.1 hypothetical protein PV07_12091 [Cladophialophora immunda]